MRKNWINWKRTLFGSISEILCPIILFGLLLAIRTLFEAETISASILYKEAKLQTPMTHLKSNEISENL